MHLKPIFSRYLSFTEGYKHLFFHAARTHWQVENSLHWSRDVTFSEDDCRIGDENAAVNFSWLRKFALGLLKNESSFKASIRRKQRKVCNNIQYLAKVIGQI
jgi:predicted transposase YbfD/YdcC